MVGAFYDADAHALVGGVSQATHGRAADGEFARAVSALLLSEYEERGAVEFGGAAGDAVTVVGVEAVNEGAGRPSGSPGHSGACVGIGVAGLDALYAPLVGVVEFAGVEGEQVLVVVFARGDGYDAGHVGVSFFGLGVHRSDSAAAVSADDDVGVAALSEKVEPGGVVQAGVVYGFVGVSGERAVGRAAGYYVVAAPVGGEECYAVGGKARAEFEVEFAVEVSAVAVEEADGLDGRRADVRRWARSSAPPSGTPSSVVTSMRSVSILTILLLLYEGIYLLHE